MPQAQMTQQQMQQYQQQQMARQQPLTTQPQSIQMPVQSQPNVLSSISIQQTSIPPHLMNNNAIYVQSKLPTAQDQVQSSMVTSMPNNSIYVQSKSYVDGGTRQYGTLKFGTKYDPIRQPGNSIPVVVPTIPKYNQNMTTNAQTTEPQNCTVSVPVQARPLPQIPQNEFQNQKDYNNR
jgi:hypothetical protein